MADLLLKGRSDFNSDLIKYKSLSFDFSDGEEMSHYLLDGPTNNDGMWSD